jgi:hypothetical protein
MAADHRVGFVEKLHHSAINRPILKEFDVHEEKILPVLSVT